MAHNTMGSVIRSIVFTSIFIMLALAVLPVAAQIAPLDKCGDLGIANCDTSSSVTTLRDKILDVVNKFLIMVEITAVIAIVYGGVKYILSSGDEKQAETAKHIIMYSVIGLIVVGLAQAIVSFALGSYQGGR